MIKKAGIVIIGIIIGVIFVGTVWYIIQGWTGTTETGKEIPIAKEDLLSSPTIETVRSKASVINFPIKVSSKKIGVAKPFN